MFTREKKRHEEIETIKKSRGQCNGRLAVRRAGPRDVHFVWGRFTVMTTDYGVHDVEIIRGECVWERMKKTGAFPYGHFDYDMGGFHSAWDIYLLSSYVLGMKYTSAFPI